MSDYSQGKIYKIVDRTNGKVYYGSTIDTLSQRLSGHLKSYKMFKEGKYQYISSFDILESENFEIVLVEEYPCLTREELWFREDYWIVNNECVNRKRPIITEEERKQKKKEGRENYKEQHNIQSKIYYQKHKEEVCQIHKKYRQDHCEEIREKDKKRYIEKKSKVRKEKITCECGRVVTRGNLIDHKKTKIHQDLLSSLF